MYANPCIQNDTCIGKKGVCLASNRSVYGQVIENNKGINTYVSFHGQDWQYYFLDLTLLEQKVFPRNRYRCSYDVVNTHWNHSIPSTIVRSNGSTPCFDAQRKKSEEGKHAQRRKAQGLAEIPEPLRALSTKQDIQVSSDSYGKSSLGID